MGRAVQAEDNDQRWRPVSETKIDGDVETTAQVQATIQRTLSASSSLEMRLGQTEEQQACARATAKALSQAALLHTEQEKMTTQISQVLTLRADATQRQLEGTTQVAMETQQKV